MSPDQKLPKGMQYCPHCDGEGFVEIDVGQPGRTRQEKIKCKVCKGSGRVPDDYERLT